MQANRKQSLHSLALAVMDFEAGVDDTREGVELLRAAIDSGVLDEAETARAYQWIRFAGDPRTITVEPKDGDR